MVQSSRNPYRKRFNRPPSGTPTTPHPLPSDDLVAYTPRPLTAQRESCPRYDKLLIVPIMVDGKVQFLHKPLPCLRWTCTKGCVVIKAHALGKRILAACQEYGLKRFVVFTIRGSLASPQASLRYIRQCLNRFQRKVRKRYGQNGSTPLYIAVGDFHESGIAHLNVFANYDLPLATIRNLWTKCGGGFKCSADFIETDADLKRAVQYVTNPKKLTTPPFPARAIRYTTAKTVHLANHTVRARTMVLQDASLEATLSYAKHFDVPTTIRKQNGQIQSVVSPDLIWPWRLPKVNRVRRRSASRKPRIHVSRKKKSPLDGHEPAQTNQEAM